MQRSTHCCREERDVYDVASLNSCRQHLENNEGEGFAIFKPRRGCQGEQLISVLMLVPRCRHPRSQTGPSTPNTTCKLPTTYYPSPLSSPAPNVCLTIGILPPCTPTRRLPMQDPFLKQLYPPTQTPVIISVARELRFRQLP